VEPLTGHAAFHVYFDHLDVCLRTEDALTIITTFEDDPLGPGFRTEQVRVGTSNFVTPGANSEVAQMAVIDTTGGVLRGVFAAAQRQRGAFGSYGNYEYVEGGFAASGVLTHDECVGPIP
jgi:hypothetical protein